MTTLAPEPTTCDCDDDRPPGHEQQHDLACLWADNGHGEE